MTLAVIARAHYLVTCDSCGMTAELCGKRAVGMSAAADATRGFRAAGWHHQADTIAWHDEAWIEAHGAGAWSCPACAPKPKRRRAPL
jgi:hypothetical protein